MILLVAKSHMALLIGAIILVIFGFFYSMENNTIFSPISKQFSPINWDEVKLRHTVTNSIPIFLLEKSNSKCTASAERLDRILDHEEFVRSSEVEQVLKYNRASDTIVVSCDKISEEKSRLTIKYVTSDSPTHATKYEYYITPWNQTIP